MMLPPIESLEQILKNPNALKLGTLNFHCQRLINDKSIQDKTKIELIDRVSRAVFGCNMNTNSHAFKDFANLYTLLCYSVSKDKNKIKCLEKAKNLFSQALKTNNKDIESIESLEKVNLQLNNLKNKVENEQKFTWNSLANSMQALTPKKREEAPSQAIIETNSNNDAIGNEFNRMLNQLTILTRDFQEANSKPRVDSQETVAVHKGMISLTETSKHLTGLAGKILEGQIHKSFATEILEISNQLLAILTTVMQRLDYLSIFEDKEMFTQNISEVRFRFSLFVKKFNPIEESNEEQHFSSPNLTDLCTASNSQPLEEQEGIKQEEKDTSQHNSSQPIVKKNDEGEFIITVFKTCHADFNLINEFINEKKLSIITSQGNLESACFAWSSFFQFTKRNYFLLDSNRKEILFSIISEAEPVFKDLLETPSNTTFILETYISILIQKHPLINDEEKKKANFHKITTYCYKYNFMYKDKIDEDKSFARILASAEPKKSSLCRLTSKKTVLPPVKLQENPLRKKIDLIIEGIIVLYEKKKKDLAIELGQSIHRESSKYKPNPQKIKALQNILFLFDYLKKVNLTRHSLAQSDMLKIAYIIESGFFFNAFETAANQERLFRQRHLILLEETTFLKRSLLIDTAKKSFTILSKLNGDIWISLETEGQIGYLTGGVKQISAAASFFWEGKEIQFKESILAVPKPNMVFNQKLIDYLYEFQGKRGLMGCYYYMEYDQWIETENVGKVMQLMVQERGGGDLYQFVKMNKLKEENEWEILFSILEDVAFGLDYLHEKGIIHWDLKLGNILYSLNVITDNDSNQCKGYINDFDTIFRPGLGEQPSFSFPVYGSTEYRAPEITDKFHEVTEAEAKGYDMFALGCVFIDILDIWLDSKPDVPLYQQVTEKMIEEPAIDEAIESLKHGFATRRQDFLKYMAYHLIHPNPQKRWKSRDFRSEICAFNSMRSAA